MKRAELIEKMLEEVNEGNKTFSRAQAVACYAAFCSVAAAELLAGGEVPLAHTGKLKVKN